MLLKHSISVALLLVATSLLPQQTWGWCYLEGFALGRGKRLYYLKTKDDTDCAKACEGVALCTHWSFDRGRSYCTLKADDPAEKVLIRRQDTAVSATADCSQAISLTTGGDSCFSDGWTVSTVTSDSSFSKDQRVSALLHSGTAQSAEDCQHLCQTSDERCVVWEWEVLTKECRSWEGRITLRRPDDLPLGFSAYTSPFEGEEVPGTQIRGDAVMGRLESMKTVVGPRVCPQGSSLQSEEIEETASRSSSSKCTHAETKYFPWIVGKDMNVGDWAVRILGLDNKALAGTLQTNNRQKNLSRTEFPTKLFQWAEDSIVLLYHDAIEAKRLTGLFVGVDTKTPAVKSITDKVASPEACQTLCKSTKSCETFTFYIDGRSGANCVLKTSIYLNEAFFHPVAITGSSTATNALALKGMKFGYEMRNTTMFTPNIDDIRASFTFEEMFQMTPKVDAMAKEACSLVGGKGYAVIDYLNNSAHAVPASGAWEVFRPNFNYIDCSKVK